MTPEETGNLLKELEQFRREKEQIRQLVGQIGGKASASRDKIINVVFLGALGLLLAVDVLRHVHLIAVPLPPMFSLELGILLVSVKIIWMIHKQAKVEHFQFWILNSIEFRLNDLSNRLKNVEQNTAPASTSLDKES